MVWEVVDNECRGYTKAVGGAWRVRSVKLTQLIVELGLFHHCEYEISKQRGISGIVLVVCKRSFVVQESCCFFKNRSRSVSPLGPSVRRQSLTRSLTWKLPERSPQASSTKHGRQPSSNLDYRSILNILNFNICY